MAITFVGSATGTDNGTVSFPGGVQTGDLVLVLTCTDGSFDTEPSISGYETLYESPSTTPETYILWKVMGSTPDTSVTMPDYDGSNSEAVLVYIFRGVHRINPIDAGPIEAEGGTGDPDCPSITTNVDGAVVVAAGFLDDDAATVSNLTGYNNTVSVSAAASGGRATAMAAWKTVSTAGAEDPPAYVTTGDDAWFGVTFSLKPETDRGFILPSVSETSPTSDHIQYADQPIGYEDASRLIVLVGSTSDNSVTLTDVEIGGVSADFEVTSYTSTSILGFAAGFIAVAHVPTGETADIDFYYSGDASGTGRVFGIWHVVNQPTDSIVDDLDFVIDESGDGDLTATIDVPSGGTSFALTYGDAYSDIFTTTWTGISEDADVPEEDFVVLSGASGTYPSAQTGLSVRSNDDSAEAGILEFKMVVAGSIGTSGATISDAVMTAAGAAAATAVGAAIAGAAMSAAGTATAAAVGESVTFADGAMSAAGSATAAAVGESLTGVDAVMAAAGAATAAAVGESLLFVDAAMDAAGSSTAIAVAQDSGLEVPDPVSFAPAGGGGAGYIPGMGTRVRVRGPKTHVIRYGEWPADPDPAEVEREERKSFQEALKTFDIDLADAPQDDEEEALMLILSLAA